MPTTIIILLASILIYILFSGIFACSLLPIGRFVSTEVRSEISVLPISGTDPAQYIVYRPTLRFRGRDRQFDLQMSDYFFSGPYTCRFGTVVASYTSNNATATSVGYTPLLGVMFWDGGVYLNRVQIPFLLLFLFMGSWIHGRIRRRSS